MRRLIAVPFIALGIAITGSFSVSAQSSSGGAQFVDEHCRSDWSTREKWGNTIGMTWPQFLTYCRTHTGAWNAEGSPGASTPASPVGTKSQHPKHAKRPTVQPASATAAPTQCKPPKTMAEYYACRAAGEVH
jgi:hypothetical protein